MKITKVNNILFDFIWNLGMVGQYKLSLYLTFWKIKSQMMTTRWVWSRSTLSQPYPDCLNQFPLPIKKEKEKKDIKLNGLCE